jgi:hypothetical protein
MGIEAGFLPATYTVPVPAGISGKPYTYSTIDLAKVMAELVNVGVSRKHSTKVADAKQKAILNTNEKLGAFFVERFKAGIWNDHAGGGPRLDPIERFVRDRAILRVKEAMRKRGIALDDVAAYEKGLASVLANEAWVAATRAEYVPPKAEIDLDDIFA